MITGGGPALAPAAQAAADVALVSGAFRRSLSVDDLRHLADTGQPLSLIHI